MFKKSRRKIVGAILLVLVLVLFGMFCVIYLASYVDTTNENRKLLELSTFYSVVLSESGEVVKVDTADISSLDEKGLSGLTLEIAESGESDGVRNNLIYRMEDKGGYTLAAFLDNTVVHFRPPGLFSAAGPGLRQPGGY